MLARTDAKPSSTLSPWTSPPHWAAMLPRSPAVRGLYGMCICMQAVWRLPHKQVHAWVDISVTDRTLKARSSGQPFSGTSLTQMPIDSWAIRMDHWAQRHPARRSLHAFFIRGGKGHGRWNEGTTPLHGNSSWMNEPMRGGSESGRRRKETPPPPLI